MLLNLDIYADLSQESNFIPTHFYYAKAVSPVLASIRMHLLRPETTTTGLSRFTGTRISLEEILDEIRNNNLLQRLQDGTLFREIRLGPLDFNGGMFLQPNAQESVCSRSTPALAWLCHFGCRKRPSIY